MEGCQVLYGYQEDDPVRVIVPVERPGGEPPTREGRIVKLLPNGYFRVRLCEPHELSGVIIEQIAVKPEQFV
jgi:hypothetical protein